MKIDIVGDKYQTFLPSGNQKLYQQIVILDQVCQQSLSLRERKSAQLICSTSEMITYSNYCSQLQPDSPYKNKAKQNIPKTLKPCFITK